MMQLDAADCSSSSASRLRQRCATPSGTVESVSPNWEDVLARARSQGAGSRPRRRLVLALALVLLIVLAVPPLGVGPNKVVPERVESLDRGLAAEAAVGSALIVEVEPGGEGSPALG